MDKEIVIGRIVAPHGVRGDLRILPLTERPEQFLTLKYFLLRDGRRYRIRSARFHKRMVLVSAEGITSMNEAELLRGQEVLIEAKDLPRLEEGRFYVADLIGLPVYSGEGTELGTFKDVISTGSNDVFVIATGARELLVPALEAYVKEINLTGRRIVIDPPEWTDEA